MGGRHALKSNYGLQDHRDQALIEATTAVIEEFESAGLA